MNDKKMNDCQSYSWRTVINTKNQISETVFLKHLSMLSKGFGGITAAQTNTVSVNVLRTFAIYVTNSGG